MAELFEIDASIKETMRLAINDLINQLGKTCRFYYAPKIVPCTDPACAKDVIGNKSGNVFITGGKVAPHLRTRCTLCNGNGTISQETYDDMKVLCNWQVKDFIHLIPNSNLIRQPYSVVSCKTFIHYLPKIVKASYFLLQVPIAPYIQYKFKLSSEPISDGNIVQGEFITFIAERAG